MTKEVNENLIRMSFSKIKCLHSNCCILFDVNFLSNFVALGIMSIFVDGFKINYKQVDPLCSKFDNKITIMTNMIIEMTLISGCFFIKQKQYRRLYRSSILVWLLVGRQTIIQSVNLPEFLPPIC